MLIKEAALGDERLYLTYKNVEVSSITTGYAAAVALGSSGASFDGTQCVLANSADATRKTMWIGIAAKDIAPNAYGIIQVYGPVNSVFVSNVGTSITINAGDACVPGALAGGVFSAVPTWLNSGFACLIASNTLPTVSATGWMSGFMKHGL